MITFAKIRDSLAELIDSKLKSVDKTAVDMLRCVKTEGMEKFALDAIIENASVAERTHSYACQDTGLAVIFAEIGETATYERLEEAINEGVRLGYAEARKSVADPLTRLNTKDNTPAIIHYESVPGDHIKLSFLAKGAGSENMSALYMLTPSKGRQGIIDSVVDCVKKAGSNPCPPLVIGVGVGGNMEKSCIMSKKALLRPTGSPSHRADCAELERDILAAVNALNIGAQGLGGICTAISVAVEAFPTHIGMLPVAVNLQCHAIRHGSVILRN